MSIIAIDQAFIHYEALGRGRPVVFLHGWIGSWRYWFPSMQVVSTEFRAYALDLFGYGNTTHDLRSYSLDKQSGLLINFIDQMAVDKVAIVGHGLGGLVGFSLACRYPERVARLMAVCTPLDLAFIDPRLINESPPMLVEWLADGDQILAEQLSDASATDPFAISSSLTAADPHEMLSRLQDIALPCLLVYGEHDPLIRLPDAESMLSIASNVHQVVLDGSGHFPMYDAGDRFHRLLMDFLTLEVGLSPHLLQLKGEWRRRIR